MAGRVDQDKWTDEEMLDALYLRDHEHMSGTAISKKIGRSRGALYGMFARVRIETEKHFPPCNADGSMSPRWWARRAGPPT